jgi:hypothetical protein
LLAFYQALVHMRTSLPILARGQRRTVHLDAEQQTYAYLRTHGTSQELDTGDVLVMFNLSNEIRTLAFPATLLPERAYSVLTTGTNPVISRSPHQIEITLTPLCGVVFYPKEV